MVIENYEINLNLFPFQKQISAMKSPVVLQIISEEIWRHDCARLFLVVHV